MSMTAMRRREVEARSEACENADDAHSLISHAPHPIQRSPAHIARLLLQRQQLVECLLQLALLRGQNDGRQSARGPQEV